MDRTNVPGDRFRYDRLGVASDNGFPPGALNPIVGELLYRFRYRFHSRRRKRNQIWITVHKAHPTVRPNPEDVAA
jgi:hypothetical protein